MKLKAVYQTLAEIPEAFRALFTERDGKYELTEVDGVKTGADIDRLTEALRKERTDHAATKVSLNKFAGYKPEDITAMEDKIAIFEADGKSGDIDAKVNSLVEARTKTLTRENERLKTELSAEQVKGANLIKERNTDRIEVSVLNVAADLVRTEALEDVKLHASRDLTIDESGAIVTRDDYAGGAGKPVKDWLAGKIEKSIHWQKTSTGGGSTGGKGKNRGNANPWKKESWNETEQSRIAISEPATAERLKKEAESAT